MPFFPVCNRSSQSAESGQYHEVPFSVVSGRPLPDLEVWTQGKGKKKNEKWVICAQGSRFPSSQRTLFFLFVYLFVVYLLIFPRARSTGSAARASTVPVRPRLGPSNIARFATRTFDCVDVLFLFLSITNTVFISRISNSIGRRAQADKT